MKILVVFNTVCLYGMERSVIETFEMLRPEVEPLFVLNQANLRHRTPLLEEIKRCRLPFRFFHDKHDWPRFGWPRSWHQAFAMFAALLRGNLDVLRFSHGADVLYLPIVTSAYISALAALWFRLSGRRVIYFFHDLPSTYTSKLRPAVALSTDLVHYARRSLAMAAAGNPFVLKRRNAVIPPAIRIRQSGQTDTIRDPHRQNIVFLGQVAPHKGVDLLIEAFGRVAGLYTNAHLMIAGGVYDENQHWFDVIRRTTPFQDRFHYLGYQEDVHEILKSAYVLAIPTRPSRFHESFGRVAAEAMAIGVPSVCFKSGALQEVVVHRETGIVCEEESASCLAAGLELLLKHPNLREFYGRNSRLRYERCYSEPVVRRDWLRLLVREASA